MASNTKYDLDKFREYVISGKTKSQIMDLLEIRGYPQFSALLLRLFQADKKVYEIASSTTSESVNKNIVIGAKGNITIPKQLLESSYIFKEGDEFTVTIKGKKITLTLIEEEETPV
jgi:hypothetical protein